VLVVPVGPFINVPSARGSPIPLSLPPCCRTSFNGIPGELENEYASLAT
jgi:hypothetical protein